MPDAIIQIWQESSTLSFNVVTDTIVNWHSQLTARDRLMEAKT